MTFLLFDIGGTWTTVGLSKDGQSLDSIERFHTPAQPKSFISSLQGYAKKHGEFDAVAGGIRGILNDEKTALDFDHLLASWIDFPLFETIKSKLGVDTVILENDSALAGLGEAKFGAGIGADILVYHDISTGVGGVKIVNGVLDIALGGFEPGHQILDIDRSILGVNTDPTLENLVSGRALEKRMNMAPEEIPQEDVVWGELAGYLAQGLRNSILYWSPEMIVLGGAMMHGDPHIPIEKIRHETVNLLGQMVPCPYITVGTLKREAGLYGALALLTQD